jgi:hypothetical protein
LTVCNDVLVTSLLLTRRQSHSEARSVSANPNGAQAAGLTCVECGDSDLETQGRECSLEIGDGAGDLSWEGTELVNMLFDEGVVFRASVLEVVFVEVQFRRGGGCVDGWNAAVM